MMGTTSQIKKTKTMKTKQLPLTVTMENGITRTAVPIIQNAFEPTEQPQKNKHMKTANLPTAKTGLNTELKRSNHGEEKPNSPQLLTLIQARAKRALLLSAMMLAMMLGFIQQGLSQTATTAFTANGTFNKPAGVTRVTVEAWGGGGAGGGVADANYNGEYSGGGGAGGAFQRGTVSTPNASYSVVVGTGGTGVSAANGNSGGNSTFGSTLVVASGGAGGRVGNSSDQTGNGASATTGTLNGGGGATGSTSSNYGGGGGGAAGNTGAGQTSTTQTGGTGGTGGTGTTGGNGGNGSTMNNNYSGEAGGSATALSGGGGGARSNNSTNAYAGGAGYRGQVIVYYYQLTSVSATTPICVGSGSTITVTSGSLLASESYTVTYSLSGDNTATDVQVVMSGTAAGSRTFTVPAASLTNSGTTTVTVTQITDGTYAGGISASNTASIVVNAAPNITSQPVSPAAVCEGSGIRTISVTATGDGLTYQWRKNGSNLSNSAPYSDVTTSTLTITNPAVSENGTTFDVIVSGTCPPAATSNGAATLTVNTLPSTPTASNDGPVCAGLTLSLSTPTVSGATYAWTGPNSFASTQQNPTILNATTAATGTYNVTITVDGCTSVAGSTVATVNALPIAGAITGGNEVCMEGSLALSSNATGTPTLTYAWASSNEATATVDNTGVVTPVAPGTTNITLYRH